MAGLGQNLQAGCSAPALLPRGQPRAWRNPRPRPPGAPSHTHPRQGPSGLSGAVGGGPEKGRAVTNHGSRRGPGSGLRGQGWQWRQSWRSTRTAPAAWASVNEHWSPRGSRAPRRRGPRARGNRGLVEGFEGCPEDLEGPQGIRVWASVTRPQLRPSELLPAPAAPSPHWPRPARSGPVTFLAKGRGEAEEAARGQGCRCRRDPALARFPPGFGPGFCRMRGRHPHCHRAFHVATRRRKMADLRPCRHNNGPRQGLRERTKSGGWRGRAMVSLMDRW